MKFLDQSRTSFRCCKAETFTYGPQEEQLSIKPITYFSRYNLYGDVSTKAAELLLEPETADFFTKLIQRVAPKSYAQAMAEVTVTGRFLQNFGGDSVSINRCLSLYKHHLSSKVNCGTNQNGCAPISALS